VSREPMGWRLRYAVWLQERGRNNDDHAYRARCEVCPPNLPNGQHWLLGLAGSRAEAWRMAREHENEVHTAPPTRSPEP
jgi:hypothetical protein